MQFVTYFFIPHPYCDKGIGKTEELKFQGTSPRI